MLGGENVPTFSPNREKVYGALPWSCALSMLVYSGIDPKAAAYTLSVYASK